MITILERQLLFPLRGSREGYCCSFLQFLCHKLSFLTFGSMLLEEVGKEEKLEDDEYDEELHANDDPQRTSEGHRAETVVVKAEDLLHKTACFHPLSRRWLRVFRDKHTQKIRITNAMTRIILKKKWDVCPFYSLKAARMASATACISSAGSCSLGLEKSMSRSLCMGMR